MKKVYLDDAEMDQMEKHFGAKKSEKATKIDWWLVVQTAMVFFMIGMVIIYNM